MPMNIVTYVAEKKDVQAVKDWYFGHYPKLGYDTRVAKERENDEGKVEITFERLTSCD